MIVEHQDCFVCRAPAWFETLSGPAAGELHARLSFSFAHEGWQGIPHGGTAMTALLELADLLCLRERGSGLEYPLRSKWRFGDSVRIGDEMELTARFREDESRLQLAMRRPESEKIYLQGELELGVAPAGADFEPPPARLLAPARPHQPLEIYDNCFVCGCSRKVPGLERRFFRTAAGLFEPPLVLVRFGHRPDQERRLAENFQQYTGRLHPGVLAALLDELCGWSGVLSGELYGFTVRFELTINALPRITDELLGLAPQPPVRGRGERCFYYPHGMLLQHSESGFGDVVAAASGQWLARPELAQQFRETHVKEDLSGILFTG